jgi:hypothetical protein
VPKALFRILKTQDVDEALQRLAERLALLLLEIAQQCLFQLAPVLGERVADADAPFGQRQPGHQLRTHGLTLDQVTFGTNWKAQAEHGGYYQAQAAGLDLYEAAPVGSAEIEALERSVEIFRAWDAARGGGLQRKAVVGQLNEVGGMLAYRHPAHLERRLWAVAANLAVLAGWMSHDVGMEPTAQKYFVIAAHAARQGGDRPRAGEALFEKAGHVVVPGAPLTPWSNCQELVADVFGG